MALIAINDNPSDRELRQFAGIWFPAFWFVIAGLIGWSFGRVGTAALIASAGAMVGAIGALRVAFIRPVYLIWMYAAFPIGWVVSHVVLGVIFFGLFTVVGGIMRILGYDPLRRRADRSAATYWVPLEPVRDKSNYFRQF